MVAVRQAQSSDAAWMQTRFDAQMGWTKPVGYFARVCQQQAKDELVLLVAHDDETYMGHAKIIWQPNYFYFRENKIPEIQDLNVLPQFRRQGVASKLMDVAEKLISERSPIAGIGFGLYADYGPAQRMYILRGYVPDGYGVMSHDQPVTPGASVPVDDDLVLRLIRRLR